MSESTVGGDQVTPTYLIRGARVVGGEPTDLLVAGGVVTRVGSGLDARGATVIDADGLVALPGLVDLHTHLREPGREDAETVESGSRAAALGGYTAVCAMANTSPVADTAGVVEQVWRLGREAGLVDVQPIGAVTVGLAGERLAELGAMADSAARVRIFSDDGHCVADPRLMRRALEYVKAFDGVIAQHAEEPRLTEGAQMHEGEVSTRLGLTGWPAVAEEAIIARDVLLAEHVGSRLHVCHLSTAGSVEVLRHAKARGVRVTAEVTPHHLLLTDEIVGGRRELVSPALGDPASGGAGITGAGYDPVFKVNPPLRTAADAAALRDALIEGIIDVVATDHAPHALEDKECEWAYARPGMLGLETALSVLLSVLGERWDLIAERMSRTPARIARLVEHGRDPAPGVPANLTLVDPAARRTVDPGGLASRSRNTPYAGMNLPGRIVATFLAGEPTVLDGKAVR
jgi:dihydroorotase